MAPRKKIDFAAVRELAKGLEGVEESTAYGFSALKVRGALMAGMAINKSAEPNSLGVRVDFARRLEMLQEAPEIYYITPHYEPYPTVLVRLDRVDRDALKDLLITAHRFVTAKKARTTKRPARAIRRKV